MRLMFEFTKGARLRYVSLLDMQRLMQRALRRSGLPIRYSGGYSPHAVMSFASALGTGVWSTGEILDVKMAQDCSPEEAFTRMNGALPADMRITRVAVVEDSHPACMASLTWADYDFVLEGGFMPIADAAQALLSETELVVMRKTKSGVAECDIRPMIGTVSVEKTEDCAIVHTRLSASELATLKPDLFIKTAAGKAGIAYETGDGEVIRRALLTGKDFASAVPIMTSNVRTVWPQQA